MSTRVIKAWDYPPPKIDCFLVEMLDTPGVGCTGVDLSNGFVAAVRGGGESYVTHSFVNSVGGWKRMVGVEIVGGESFLTKGWEGKGWAGRIRKGFWVEIRGK